jgi:hypothetical protein
MFEGLETTEIGLVLSIDIFGALMPVNSASTSCLSLTNSRGSSAFGTDFSIQGQKNVFFGLQELYRLWSSEPRQ